MAGFGVNMGEEVVEGAGGFLADQSGFAKYTAAWLFSRLGQKGAFAVTKTLEATLKTVAEKLGGKYADMLSDGFFDGVGDAVLVELKFIAKMDEKAREKHIAKVLGKKDDKSHDAHADAHGHGAKHDAGHAQPAGEVIHLFDALAALSPKEKEQAQDVIGYLDEAYPDYLGAVIHLQDRPGFTRRFLKRITGMSDIVLIKLAIRELVGNEVGKIQHEEASKPKPFAARLRQGVDRLAGGIDGLLDEMGVPSLEAGHGHDAHALPVNTGHGHNAPYRGMALHTHAAPHNPNPAGSGFGTDWNTLRNRLKGGSGH